MATELRKTGIEMVGDLPWGTHFCHFYETREDLLDILIPYFRAGLENNEFCTWVVFDPFNVEEARKALIHAFPEANRYLAAGDMEIVSHRQWFPESGVFDLQSAIDGWNGQLTQALEKGYAGLRGCGHEVWLTEKNRKNFAAFEKKLDELIAGKRMIVVCTYLLAVTKAADLFDAARTHQFAIARRHGNWEVLETPDLRQAKAEIMRLNEDLEQRVIDRTGELAKINEELRREIADRRRAEKEREDLQMQLIQAQKLESLGRLAGGVAHDFNNMLAVILGYTELALLELTDQHGVRGGLEEVMAAAKRSANLVGQLLAFARKQMVNPVPIDLNDSLPGMLKMLRRLIGEDIDLAFMPAHALWKVRVDPSQLDQLLANLTINARDAIAGVGKVSIETGNVTLDEEFCAVHPGCVPGDYVLLAVSDNGRGMDKETLSDIFEPFFTTKEMGMGTGLGLATVYGVVKQNDGFIYVDSELGQGTTFKIYLPRFESESVESPIGKTKEEVQIGTETVLLVEDEEAVLKLGRILLEQLGYMVLTARAPNEAIRLAEVYAGRIDLLVTDVVLPEMNGRDLAERLTSIRPYMKCLYMSGYSANVIAQRAVLPAGVHFIQKPFMKEALAKKVRETLEQESKTSENA
jgi:signal transduction histidine kinase/ActR/RegA family two-component response regulator